MGFSRACRMPSMVIFGRFITGVHSGRPDSSIRFILNKKQTSISQTSYTFYFFIKLKKTTFFSPFVLVQKASVDQRTQPVVGYCDEVFEIYI